MSARRTRPGCVSCKAARFSTRFLDRCVKKTPLRRRPLLIKIAPDLDEAQVADVVNAAEKYRLAGIVATNTTIDKRGLSVQEEGGASGRPLTARSTEIIRMVHRLSGGRIPIIGVGGIFNAADAQEKLEAGASLLQLYTGFVYEGPLVARANLRGPSPRRRIERELPVVSVMFLSCSRSGRRCAAALHSNAVEGVCVALDRIRHFLSNLEVGELSRRVVDRDLGDFVHLVDLRRPVAFRG